MTMCIDSGLWEMKSNCRLASWRKVTGSGFWEWMKSGNLIASRMKKTLMGPRGVPASYRTMQGFGVNTYSRRSGVSRA